MANFFETPTFKFLNAKRNEPVEFSFKLLEPFTGDDIHYITVACGSCTKSWYDPETNSVVGTLDLTKAATNATSKAVMKSIAVYFDPEVPEFVAKEGTKERIFNSNKRRQALQLSGTIID